MERQLALPSGDGMRLQGQNQVTPSSISAAASGPANEAALEELEELGLYLAHEDRLEREEMRRRGRLAKWTETKRRRKREP